MSIYAIGDLQGCYFSLQSLLDTLSFNKEEDELWFVGDLVNRGKGSLEVLDWCYKNQRNIKVVLGNHDLHFLSVALRAKSISNKDTIETILRSKNLSKYIDWLLSLPLVFCIVNNFTSCYYYTTGTATTTASTASTAIASAVATDYSACLYYHYRCYCYHDYQYY